MRSVFVEKPDPLELRLKSRTAVGYLWTWLPVAVALFVIANESTATFSANNTSSALRPFFERLFGAISEKNWWWFHHLLRKSGHFCGYGAVCVTFVRAWLITLGGIVDWGRTTWRRNSALLAIASTACVASLDEWHQTFLPSRTGMVSDVGLDTIGAAVSCGVIWFFFWRRKKGRGRRSLR